SMPLKILICCMGLSGDGISCRYVVIARHACPQAGSLTGRVGLFTVTSYQKRRDRPLPRDRKPMRASDIRRGQAVIMDGTLFIVTNADHNTPGNLRAKVQFKLRDVKRGTILDKRVGATDDIETATLDRRTVEYLYSDGDNHVFMDTETYDQPAI